MKLGTILSVLVRALASVLLVYLLFRAPSFLLVRAIPWLPTSVDPWFLIFAVQVTFFLIAACSLRLPRAVVAGDGVTAAGARAVFWLLSGEVLFALLGAITVISTSDAGAVGFTVANGVQALTRDFPHSGLAGGMLVKVMLGPAFEEFVFRVFLLGFLLRPVRPWVALLASTAVFASVHSSWIYSAFGGLVYGLLYLRYRNVWLCIAAHAANNLVVSTGAPFLVAHLHELGVLSPVRDNLLALQLSWAAVVLACFAMFLACLLRKDDGKELPSSRSG